MPGPSAPIDAVPEKADKNTQLVHLGKTAMDALAGRQIPKKTAAENGNAGNEVIGRARPSRGLFLDFSAEMAGFSQLGLRHGDRFHAAAWGMDPLVISGASG
jgi:hypothetical protein